MSKGGFVGAGSPTDDRIPVTLRGCTVHGKPHPRAFDKDCDSEWVINASAVQARADVQRWLNQRHD